MRNTSSSTFFCQNSGRSETLPRWGPRPPPPRAPLYFLHFRGDGRAETLARSASVPLIPLV